MNAQRVLITGGAGFIGSALTRHCIAKGTQVLVIDKLTYAGNLENLRDVDQAPNYVFEHGSILDAALLRTLFEKYQFDGVIHLAAESHVDRSISIPVAFVETNVLGTASLLLAAKEHWNNQYDHKIFYHISTDEVYGSLGETGFFTETTAYDPRSPYSASKASSDHIVRAFYHTYQLLPALSFQTVHGFHHFSRELKLFLLKKPSQTEGLKKPVEKNQKLYNQNQRKNLR